MLILTFDGIHRETIESVYSDVTVRSDYILKLRDTKSACFGEGLGISKNERSQTKSRV